jgi:hypothetical protein
MSETTESQANHDSERPCCCGTNPLHCLDKAIRENPTRAIWWCLGIGFLAGWKLKSCLHSTLSHKS